MKNAEISRIICRVYRRDLIHLGEMDELHTALMDLFNPRIPRADPRDISDK